LLSSAITSEVGHGLFKPYERNESTTNLQYSFEVIAVHIIMTVSDMSHEEGSEQHVWLI